MNAHSHFPTKDITLTFPPLLRERRNERAHPRSHHHSSIPRHYRAVRGAGCYGRVFSMNAFDFTARQFRNATMAERILAGEIPPADWPVFTAEQWRAEAQAVLDTGDDSELRWMLDHQEEVDREEEQARRDAWWGRRDPRKQSWWNA